jgi:hypothetical protein
MVFDKSPCATVARRRTTHHFDYGRTIQCALRRICTLSGVLGELFSSGCWSKCPIGLSGPRKFEPTGDIWLQGLT